LFFSQPPLFQIKNIGIYGTLGLVVCGVVAPAQAQPTVQVVWEGPATKPLRNSDGIALSAGLAAEGDGVLLELGYFDAATAEAPFVGKFVALTGASSADPALRTTSIGDAGGGAAGTFSISTNFNAGAVVFQGAPPEPGTPLVIRFFNGKTVAGSTAYNVVSGGANWQWKAPAEVPGAFVILSMADSGLVWQGGAASSFKTTIPGPPPEISAGGGGGGGSADEIPSIIGAALTLEVPPENKAASYVAANLPPGLRLNQKTGEISGTPTKPGDYALKVTPYNAAKAAQTPVTFRIKVAGLSPGVVGKFSGLVERSTAVNSNLGASVQLTTTGTGLYSGKLLVGTRSYTLKGRLGLEADRPTAANVSVPLPQLGPNATLVLEFDGESQSFSGALSKGGTSASVQGWQTPWSAATPATERQGAYTYRLKTTDGSETVPQGYGYGTLNVTAKTGLVALTTTLADGTRVTGSAALGKDGEVAVYTSSAAASLSGTLALSAGTSAASLKALAGTLSWLKPAAAGTVYKEGFGPLDLEAAGGAPAAVAKGSLVLGLEPVSGALLQNAELSFAEGGLDLGGEQQFSRPVAIKSTTSAAKHTATLPTGTPATTLSVLNPATGAFSGTFLLEGSTPATNRTARFQGQVVTIDGETQGYGFFLLPTLTGASVATAPKLSGSVVLAKP
jgi:hypothetical protein